jgi:hypothetical protein
MLNYSKAESSNCHEMVILVSSCYSFLYLSIGKTTKIYVLHTWDISKLIKK